MGRRATPGDSETMQPRSTLAESETEDRPVPLMTVAEAARFLRVSASFLNKARLTGDGPPYFTVGRCIRYSRSALLSWVSERLRHSTSEPGRARVTR